MTVSNFYDRFESMKNKILEELVVKTRLKFPSFGGGLYTDYNPISIALRNKNPQFAAGVDIEEVIKFVVKQYKTIKSKLVRRLKCKLARKC